MPALMLASPPSLGANTARVRPCVMLVTVASCRMPPACTNPRSGRPSGEPHTSATATSTHDTSARTALTAAPPAHSLDRAASAPDTRPERPSSHIGASSNDSSHSAVSMPSEPSPPERMYSPPRRTACGGLTLSVMDEQPAVATRSAAGAEPRVCTSCDSGVTISCAAAIATLASESDTSPPADASSSDSRLLVTSPRSEATRAGDQRPCRAHWSSEPPEASAASVGAIRRAGVFTAAPTDSPPHNKSCANDALERPMTLPTPVARTSVRLLATSVASTRTPAAAASCLVAAPSDAEAPCTRIAPVGVCCSARLATAYDDGMVAASSNDR